MINMRLDGTEVPSIDARHVFLSLTRRSTVGRSIVISTRASIREAPASNLES
jgi:hypothetical protein